MEVYKLIFLELFSGTKTMSEAFKRCGFAVYNVDNNPKLEPSLVADISILKYQDLVRECGDYPTVIWASPDCTKFSYASGNRNEFRKANTEPLSNSALNALDLVKHTLKLIDELQPTYWFLENPLHGALKDQDFMKEYMYMDVSYCRYGAKNQKPTRIWGNFPPSFRPKFACHHIKHEVEFRNISGKKARAEIPIELGYDLAENCILDNGLQIMNLRDFI